MTRGIRNQSGFTLIEMLIVIIVLGILAMVIIPQISVSTDDAKVSTLQTNVSGIRSAIETYYAQHSNTYPGKKKNDGSADASSAGEAQTAFIEQLTQYTSSSGAVDASKDNTYKYGPYIRATGSGTGLPDNPFTEANTLVCDINTATITTRERSGTESWKFYTKTGVFIANDTTDHATF